MPPDIAKVTLTGTGELSPGLRFFTEGEAERYVFSPHEIDSLQNIATVISTGEPITAKLIVTQLEKRGVERLMVEGGAAVLRMFLGEGMADTLRLAVNPQLRLGSAAARNSASHRRRALRRPAKTWAAWRSRPTRCIPTPPPQTCVS